MLIHLLVTKVLQSIFEQHCLETGKEAHLHDQIQSLPGGKALLNSQSKSSSSGTQLTVAYLIPGVHSDEAA